MGRDPGDYEEHLNGIIERLDSLDEKFDELLDILAGTIADRLAKVVDAVEDSREELASLGLAANDIATNTRDR